jgi:hypothetical protein
MSVVIVEQRCFFLSFTSLCIIVGDISYFIF